MKGYRRHSGEPAGCESSRFHVERDPFAEELDRRVNYEPTTIAIVGVVIAAAGASYTAYSAHEAAGEQKKIAAANAARIKAENEEALRRLKKQQAVTLAEARARAAASGVSTEGTQKTYLDEMKEAFKSETDWLRSAGASQAFITAREGELRAKTTSASGISSGLSQAGGAVSYYGSSM